MQQYNRSNTTATTACCCVVEGSLKLKKTNQNSNNSLQQLAYGCKYTDGFALYIQQCGLNAQYWYSYVVLYVRTGIVQPISYCKPCRTLIPTQKEGVRLYRLETPKMLTLNSKQCFKNRNGWNGSRHLYVTSGTPAATPVQVNMLLFCRSVNRLQPTRHHTAAIWCPKLLRISNRLQTCTCHVSKYTRGQYKECCIRPVNRIYNGGPTTTQYSVVKTPNPFIGRLLTAVFPKQQRTTVNGGRRRADLAGRRHVHLL